ncbi:hypothetical protein [Pseudophaeobacter sp.]|uniref:hypothetical protein n=1 Tax=Pseudophaeobacter sp. TaxID=1971739 RepID=UPI00329723A9
MKQTNQVEALVLPKQTPAVKRRFGLHLYADVPSDHHSHEATPACDSCFTNPNSPLPLAHAIGSTCMGLLFHLSIYWGLLFFSEIPITQQEQNPTGIHHPIRSRTYELNPAIMTASYTSWVS